MYNKVVLLHLNPNIGKIYVYELDPTFIYRFQQQINVDQGCLCQMQVVDNLLVVHNLDNKDSQIYDFKIQDYSRPLIQNNLNINTSFVDKDAFMSDVVFPEEREVVDEFRGVTSNPE